LNPPTARNIELKTRCRDLDAALAAVRPLSPTDAGVQHQIDTYFPVPNGRLKLREIAGVRAELIWYDRSNSATTRRSDYRLTPVTHPAELRASLDAALGTRGQVRKRRHVLIWHNVRIHLDEVDSLGSFVEFEAVMSAGETEEIGHARLRQLCEVMNIAPGDYLAVSYADLLGLE
jgi:adenylate cyclase class IV